MGNYDLIKNACIRNDRLKLRRVQPHEKKEYCSLLCSLHEDDFYDDETCDAIMDVYMNSDEMELVIVDNHLGRMVGIITLNSKDRDIPELFVNIANGFRRSYYGTDAVKLLMEHLKEISGTDRVEARAYEDDALALRFLETIGAVKTGKTSDGFESFLRIISECIGKKDAEEIAEEAREHPEYAHKLRERKSAIYEIKA